jgi:hypothetical protein
VALFGRIDGKPSTFADDREMSAAVSRGYEAWAREFPDQDIEDAYDDAHARYLQLVEDELREAGYVALPLPDPAGARPDDAPLQEPTESVVATEPALFDLYIGHPGAGYSITVRWEHNELTWTSQQEEGTKVLAVHPSAEDWTAFWGACDDLGLWDWREYPAQAEDGQAWSLRAIHAGRGVVAGGQNAYPPTGAFGSSREFEQFSHAVRTLLGGLPFE